MGSILKLPIQASRAFAPLEAFFAKNVRTGIIRLVLPAQCLPWENDFNFNSKEDQ